MDIITKENPVYHPHPIDSYRGNPLIEALNPIPMNKEEAIERMKLQPEFDESELELPAVLRASFPLRLRRYFFPTDKSVHIMYRIYLQILDSYSHKNPLSVAGQKLCHNPNDPIETIRIVKNRPSSISFITGLSGMGKTTTIERILSVFGATVIIHNNYKGTPLHESQIVYLKCNIGEQITPKFFTKQFGNETDVVLGRDLYSEFLKSKNLSGQDYKLSFRRIAVNHFIGMVVADEVQNLKLAKSKGKEFISLLINSRDEVGVPIALVGTYSAADILRKDASITRRLVEGGFHEIERPLSSKDEDFGDFCEIMWEYQWLKDKKPLDDNIIDMLYDCSMGITGLMINLFIFAQLEALETKKEFIDAKMLKSVYRNHFKPFHKIINALRSNERNFLDNYDDLYLKAFKEMNKVPAQSRYSELLEETKKAKSKRVKRSVDVLQKEVLGDDSQKMEGDNDA